MGNCDEHKRLAIFALSLTPLILVGFMLSNCVCISWIDVVKCDCTGNFMCMCMLCMESLELKLFGKRGKCCEWYSVVGFWLNVVHVCWWEPSFTSFPSHRKHRIPTNDSKRKIKIRSQCNLQKKKKIIMIQFFLLLVRFVELNWLMCNRVNCIQNHRWWIVSLELYEKISKSVSFIQIQHILLMINYPCESLWLVWIECDALANTSHNFVETSYIKGIIVICGDWFNVFVNTTIEIKAKTKWCAIHCQFNVIALVKWLYVLRFVLLCVIPTSNYMPKNSMWFVVGHVCRRYIYKHRKDPNKQLPAKIISVWSDQMVRGYTLLQVRM